MTLSPQEPERPNQIGKKQSNQPKTPTRAPQSLADATLPKRGLTQAEADAIIADLPEVRREKAIKQTLQLSLNEIGLPERTAETLFREGIFTVENLLNRQASELRALPQFDDTTIRQIYHCVSRLGFHRQTP